MKPVYSGLVFILAAVLISGCGAVTNEAAMIPTIAVFDTPTPPPSQPAQQASAVAISEPGTNNDTSESTAGDAANNAGETEEYILAEPVDTRTPIPPTDEVFLPVVPVGADQPTAVPTQPIQPIAQQPAPNVPLLVAFGRLGEPVRGTVVVRFPANTSPAQRQRSLEDIDAQIEQELGQLNAAVINVPDGTTLPDVMAAGISQEPDYLVQALSVAGNDAAQLEQQWALRAINAEGRWAALPDDPPAVVVAVIDSGVCLNHPDLDGQLVPGYDFVEDDTTPQDAYGHGCGVAGLIAARADNEEGIVGAAPNAKVMPLRVLDADGIGRYSDVAAAIVYAVDHGAQVINVAVGGLYESSVLAAAVDYAVARDVIVIAAAGNGATDELMYPAAYPAVIAVGAVGPDLAQSNFSNFGGGVDVMAPGQSVLTTSNDGGYQPMSGTSFAASYAAGVAALQIGTGESGFIGGSLVDNTFSDDINDAPVQAVESVAMVPEAPTAPTVPPLFTGAMTLNRDVLPASGADAAPQITLNLRGDATYTATAGSTLARPSGAAGYVWAGRVDGDAASEVVLVVSDDAVNGHVRTAGRLFAVRPAGDATHRVTEVTGTVSSAAFNTQTATMMAGSASQTRLTDTPNTIDVLVAYAPAAAAAQGGAANLLAAVDANIIVANSTFAASGANTRFNLVHTAQVNGAAFDSLNGALTAAADGAVPTLHRLRNTHAADLVAVIVNTGDECGLSYEMVSPSLAFAPSAYSVVNQRCLAGGTTLARSFAHNMGLPRNESLSSGSAANTLNQNAALVANFRQRGNPYPPNMVTNGDFAQGINRWSLGGDADYSVSDGVLTLTNTAGARPIAITQPLPYRVPAGSPFIAAVDVGNASSTTKNVALRLRDGDGRSDITCNFQLAPNTPLRTYTMAGVAGTEWLDPVYQVFINGDTEPSVWVDNLRVSHAPGAGITETRCTPPPPDANLVGNPTFDTGLSPWRVTNGAATVSNGSLSITGTATVSQPLPIRPASGASFVAHLALGNPGDVPTAVTVQLTDGATAETCNFSVPAGAPLTLYTLRITTRSAWASAALQLTVNDDQAALRVDNVRVVRDAGTYPTVSCDTGGGLIAQDIPDQPSDAMLQPDTLEIMEVAPQMPTQVTLPTLDAPTPEVVPPTATPIPPTVTPAPPTEEAATVEPVDEFTAVTAEAGS